MSKRDIEDHVERLKTYFDIWVKHTHGTDAENTAKDAHARLHAFLSTLHAHFRYIRQSNDHAIELLQGADRELRNFYRGYVEQSDNEDMKIAFAHIMHLIEAAKKESSRARHAAHFD